MSKQKQQFKQAKINEAANFSIFPFVSAKIAYLVLGIVGFIFYINTINNEFALDDGIIIHKNEYVMKGSKGIKDILTHDAYYSFYRQMNAEDQLAGGRYRPLSVVSFAMEQNFIGAFPTGRTDGNSWDVNKNNIQDPGEDVNEDGLFNENDALTRGSGLRHFNNMLFYVLSVLILFGFLKNYLFKNNWDLAFLTALLFCIHPIHTEVVANMKSRDEIFSFLFIILTFIYVFKALELRTTKHIVLAGFMYFLALLSKEYAFTLIFVIPMMIYIFRPELIDFKDKKLWGVFTAFLVFAVAMYELKSKGLPGYQYLPFVFGIIIVFAFQKDFQSKTFTALFGSLTIAFLMYLSMRFISVTLKPAVPDTEVLNNPYLFATKTETYATKIYVLLKYMKLLFIPHPLSSDYSFNTIVYRNFGSWDTLLSIVLYIGLAITTFMLFIKRHILSFGLIFFFANLLMIGNIVFDIGATMGERLIYHSSFGFALCIAWLLIEGPKKLNVSPSLQKNSVLGIAIVLTGLFGYKTIERNAEWKSDITLFTKDVKTVPNSVLCLGNAGARWIDLSERPENKDSATAFLNRAVGYLKHALDLHPKYVNGYLNLGLAQMKQGDLDGAYTTWKTAQKLYPNNPYLQSYFPYLAVNYMNKGVTLGQQGKLDEGLPYLEKAVECNPNNYDIWYNYAGVYFTKGNWEKAKTGFENCLKLNPNAENAKQGLQAVNEKLGTTSTVAVTAPILK
ncbi:MAG: tetratricopeptide repeat protein [Bacteroidota bacterium]|nr:tetratricopeptide repeat protein [Bacteroidota bacterium]